MQREGAPSPAATSRGALPVQRQSEGGAAASGAVRGAVRGMSYAAGAAHLAPVQRSEAAAAKPPDGAPAVAPASSSISNKAPAAGGTLAVSSSSGAREITEVGAFTPELAKRIGAGGPIDAALDAMAAEVQTSTHGLVTHPSIARMGAAAGPAFGSGPNRQAVFVANSHYADAPVPALRESVALEDSIAGRGFTTTRSDDQNAPGIDVAFGSALRALRAGDELFLSYVGHGSKDGLHGIENSWQHRDILSHGAAIKPMRQALDRGAHVRFVATACMSGHATENLRDWGFDRLERSSAADGHWLGLVEAIDAIKRELGNAETAIMQGEDALEAAAKSEVAAEAAANPDAKKQEQDLYLEARRRVCTQLRAQISAAWAALRPRVVAIADEVAGADGKAAAVVPVDIDVRWRTERSERGMILGDVLDCFGDLANRCLALAGGPAKLAG